MKKLTILLVLLLASFFAKSQNYVLSSPNNILTANIDLLPGNYRIEAIEDGVNADKRAEDYRLIKRHFKADEILNLNLAPGGGWVAIITPEK